MLITGQVSRSLGVTSRHILHHVDIVEKRGHKCRPE